MAVLKLSQITTAGSINFRPTDLGLVGVGSGNIDGLYSFAQTNGYVQIDKGGVSGTATFNVGASGKQKVTVSGTPTFAFTSWDATGNYSEVEIQLVNGGAATITWPTGINWLKGDGTNATAFSSMGVTLATAGTNFIILWSTDGGTTLYGRAA